MQDRRNSENQQRQSYTERPYLKIEPASFIQQQLRRHQLSDVPGLEVGTRSISLCREEVESAVECAINTLEESWQKVGAARNEHNPA